jgi:hypothetical protein
MNAVSKNMKERYYLILLDRTREQTQQNNLGLVWFNLATNI